MRWYDYKFFFKKEKETDKEEEEEEKKIHKIHSLNPQIQDLSVFVVGVPTNNQSNA